MGQARRPQPARLAIKLRQIRTALDFTQEQMAERLKRTKSPPQPGHISEFEQGKREPSLPVLLLYGRVAGVYVDALIDDDLELPEHLPLMPEREWITRCDRTGKRGRG
jgi:transcriptional regulator with XRE-family HTH domain